MNATLENLKVLTADFFSCTGMKQRLANHHLNGLIAGHSLEVGRITTNRVFMPLLAMRAWLLILASLHPEVGGLIGDMDLAHA